MPSARSTDSFYLDLPTLADFNSLSEPRCYARAPSDWRLILTDIRGSTKAIREGRYKDVNTLGAASIAAVLRALEGLSIPFVFGGDGATLLVPEVCSRKALPALAGLRRLARERFHLDLRVGSIAVSELERLGGIVEVAKAAVSESCQIAALRGRGLQIAEEKIKMPNSPYEFREDESRDPDLAGLSCRWKPFQSSQGKILAIIVEARPDSHSDPDLTYRRVLNGISSLFPNGIAQANPAEAGFRGYRQLVDNLRDESRYQSHALSFSFLKRVLEALIAGIVFRRGCTLPVVKRYIEDTARHCDFRKFDSSLRAVLDCNPTQALGIEKLLEDEHRSNKIYYGVHESDEALMTCLVEGLGPGQHLHFIDAAGGGYALAAARLKAQKQKVPEETLPGPSET